MVRSCLICKRTEKDGVRLFAFPKDPDTRKLWMQYVDFTRGEGTGTVIGYLCKNSWHSTVAYSSFALKASHRVCSLHFTLDMIINKQLSKIAIPCLRPDMKLVKVERIKQELESNTEQSSDNILTDKEVQTTLTVRCHVEIQTDLKTNTKDDLRKTAEVGIQCELLLPPEVTPSPKHKSKSKRPASCNAEMQTKRLRHTRLSRSPEFCDDELS